MFITKLVALFTTPAFKDFNYWLKNIVNVYINDFLSALTQDVVRPSANTGVDYNVKIIKTVVIIYCICCTLAPGLAI